MIYSASYTSGIYGDFDLLQDEPTSYVCWLQIQCGALQIAKQLSWFITPITLVYDTQITMGNQVNMALQTISQLAGPTLQLWSFLKKRTYKQPFFVGPL